MTRPSSLMPFFLPHLYAVQGVANGTRAALDDGVSPAQFAALYRALTLKADTAFAVTRALPQVSSKIVAIAVLTYL